MCSQSGRCRKEVNAQKKSVSGEKGADRVVLAKLFARLMVEKGDASQGGEGERPLRSKKVLLAVHKGRKLSKKAIRRKTWLEFGARPGRGKERLDEPK